MGYSSSSSSSYSRCSALRQVPGTHFFHSFLPPALLFIFTNEPSIRSSIIPLLGLSRGLFPNILPFNTSLSNPSPLSKCPIQLFFLWYIVLMGHLFSFTIANTSSLLFLPIQLILSNLLHNHISRAFNLSISAVSIVHVSQSYCTTGHISTFTSLFFKCLTQSFCQKLLLNASFACAILYF